MKEKFIVDYKNPETLKNANPALSFFPVRFLLCREDIDNLISDKNLDLWILFTFNNGIKLTYSSNIVKNLNSPLMYSYFQEIEINLHFLVKHTTNDKFINFLQEFRITLQNFMIALEVGAYYVAFTEYRKILECCLRIKLISEDKKYIEFQKMNDSNTYGQLFLKYLPNLKKIWTSLSLLVHPNNDKLIISFNINKIYGVSENNNIDEYINLIIDTSKEVYATSLELFDFFNEHEQLIRYKKILEHLDYLRIKKYKLQNNYDATKNKNTTYKASRDEVQKSIELIHKNKNTKDDELKVIMWYIEYISFWYYSSNAMDNISCQDFNKIKNEKDIDALFSKTKIEYYFNKHKKHEISGKFAKDYIFSWEIFDFYTEQNPIHLCPYIDNQIYSNISYMVVLLLLVEIKENFTNKKIAILKSYFEDFLLLLSFSKIEMYGMINSLIEFSQNFFNYKIKNEKINQHLKSGRHSLIENRSIYWDSDFNTTGDKSYIAECLQEMEDLLDFVLTNWLDKNYKKIYMNEENEYYKLFNRINKEISESYQKYVYYSFKDFLDRHTFK